jgi:hypothetical protein
MTQFYYWVPQERPSCNSQELINLLRLAGLGYAIEERIVYRSCDKGPDGQKGNTVCWDNDGRLGYFPERQVWRRVPGCDVWCGCDAEDKPKPADLARAEQISGEWITLDDGNQWLAPKARRWCELDDRLLWDYNLPRRMTLNDDGLWVPGGVKPRYERLWQLANDYEASYSAAMAEAGEDDSVVRFVFEEIDTLAIGALQINYRVGPVELDMLGVYDQAVRQRIIDVLLDNATWVSWIKKKLHAAARNGESS